MHSSAHSELALSWHTQQNSFGFDVPRPSFSQKIFTSSIVDTSSHLSLLKKLLILMAKVCSFSFFFIYYCVFFSFLFFFFGLYIFIVLRQLSIFRSPHNITLLIIVILSLFGCNKFIDGSDKQQKIASLEGFFTIIVWLWGIFLTFFLR